VQQLNRWLSVILTGCALASASVNAQESPSGICSPNRFEDARFVFHRAWFEQADEQFDEYIATCADDPRAHAYAAIIDMLLYRDNSLHVAHAMRLADSFEETEALFVKALARFAQGQLEETESYLRQYLLAVPTDRYAAHVLGFTLNDQGNPDKGVEVLQQLLESDPGYFPAKNHLAYGLFETDRADEAMQVIREFVVADPANPSAWDTQADILDSLGRSEEAIASLSRSVLLDKRFAYGYRHLGNILLTTGDLEAAKAAYRNALLSAETYGPAFTASVEQLLVEMDSE
jgi:tetratricopeptide (TPR) repeat protein